MQFQEVVNPSFIKSTLPKVTWLSHAENHSKNIGFVIDKYLVKRSQGLKQPVMDFLFEYYPFRPSWLKKWSPGLGVALELENPSELPNLKGLIIGDGVAYLDPFAIPEKRKKSFEWILHLLKNTREKRPSFGCFGMHEWAMVYKSEAIRHSQVPLRMEPQELAEFVESRPLVCTHFDAFRFFTPEAIPLNKNQLSRETFVEMEQPGCIHSNMDLYKWAFKGFPWVSSDTVFAAFKLACEAREIDMKASPYDLRSQGLEPIKIETVEGRAEYLEAQQSIFEKGIPVREKLIEEFEMIVSNS
jgi:hypothetical protein